MSELARRRYDSVSVGGGGGTWQVLLDGRPRRTPRRSPLSLPTRRLADAVSLEWAAQGERIDPYSMPLTRLANTAVDLVAPRQASIVAEIVKMAAHDLVCYRAEGPEALRLRQAGSWDPVLGWAMEQLDARFAVTTGVVPIDQPAEALLAFARLIERQSSWRLAALHNMATLTGSALIAAMCTERPDRARDAWLRAHVDEDWQIENWGEDLEAMERRRIREGEFMACVRLIQLAC